ncbi:bifunctional diguanylate cyclase/phosphodiesterase [Cryobacterium sp. 1639]|uniref:putative bifunctional diguanylate cyclase/phosphodiesterase n=1 Tax=Cryobacterium inferilacus TaxID=2866629 RepID=UPI001C72F9B8|nr:bifunctional diguanylate cyclase/phosphodiesterase [Cryobacterium sp. 1639]MBX0301482.1 bifunctional diguanylate cyclase/phosphodiesterase [Cryobacterium sp. 1639]
MPAALTELPTRSQVMARMDSARSGDGPNDLGVLLVVNLDRFSLVNEGLGHDAGDRFLLYAAQQINGATRDNDIVARLGADEFLILCEGVGARSGRIIAERIVTAFQKSVTLGGHELRITVSVGITTVNRDMTPLDAVRQALSATQRAKTNGRNQAAHFDSTGSIQAMHWHDLERALSVALERDQFVLHFQPISCIRDGSLHGVEARVRWNRPDHGLIPPDVFIPVAEESGFIHELGVWVLNEALRQLSSWKASRSVPPGFYVSVNLSPAQITDSSLVATIKGAVAAHGITPAELTLEMTETALIADEALMVATVDALAAAGISLSIDDFGTGYSSLARLRHLPAKQLKVDRSFVAGLTTDKRDAALVAAVIGLAHEFGMTCVAEGVETAEQFDHLRRLGCDFAQGYLLGRPMPAAALEETWDLATAS